jgi:hypothetical protein
VSHIFIATAFLRELGALKCSGQGFILFSFRLVKKYPPFLSMKRKADVGDQV